MPQAAVIAGIGAAAQIGSAVVGSRASSGATKAQLKANEDAMNYERQRQAEDQKRRDEAAAAYRQAWESWYQRNGDEGVRRYGVPVGIQIPGQSTASPTTGPAVRMPGSTVEPAPAVGSPVVGGMSAGMSPVAPMPGGSPTSPAPAANLGMLMDNPQAALAPPAPTAQPAQQSTRPRSQTGWENWNQYGV